MLEDIKTAETWNVKMTECPYCGKDQEAYEEDGDLQTCDMCGKDFRLEA